VIPKAQIERVLFEVVDELNRMLPESERLAKELQAPLAGDFGKLDSAGLINLIALTEEATGRALGRPVLLTDERTLAQIPVVFRTLGTLADHIHLLLNEDRDG
jgi:acyl carrier protein